VRAAALCAAAALLPGLASSALADRVITRDGRILEPRKARQEGLGWRLVFEHGEILVEDPALLRSVEVEGDMSDYVPADDEERRLLAEGYVRHEGKWLSKPAYEQLLKKRFEAARARTEEIARHSAWVDAWEQETKHFKVRSNTSPELLDYYAELLEAYYSLMDDRIGIDPTPTYRRIKMAVNVFKSKAEFHKYSQAKSPGVLGYFWAGDNSLNFYHNYADPAQSTWVALHECTHLLTFLVDQQYNPQIWLNEAVADYFGSSKVSRDKKGKLVIEPGQLQTDRVLTVQQAIEAGNDVKLSDLFLITRDAFRGFEYAHAWSFVYFLNTFEDGRWAKTFAKFFKALYTLEKGIPFEPEPGPPPHGVWKTVKPEDIRDELLERMKVKDIGVLERQWKQFVAAIPVEGPEALLKRGSRAAAELEFEKALPDLDAAIEQGTTNPRAWGLRARARAATGDGEGARKDYEEALKRDPLNAGFRYELAKVIVGEFASETLQVSVVDEDEQKTKLDDPEAKLQAGLAVELAPDNDWFREFYGRFE
jgi:tetratricopeptide (TPR) repeat protein